MPSCIINTCRSKTGRKGQNKDVVMHPFPKDVARIKDWLLATGQVFQDVDSIAQRISEQNKSNKYRMCSLHFTQESYRPTKNAKLLKSKAFPSIFLRPEEGEVLIDFTRKKPKTFRIRPYDQPEMATCSSYNTGGISVKCEFDPQNASTKCSVATQTESTLLNSVIIITVEPESSTELHFHELPVHYAPTIVPKTEC